nr:dihydrolipoyllysine-residue succinyltransferase [Actinomycetota bacterium]
MADVTMPQLGETVTEGTIIKWLKAVGDSVAEDEPLFEVSTDKVDSEVPSTVTGKVAEILVPEGETVDVGTKLAVIAEGHAARSGAPPEPAAAPAAEPAAAPDPVPAASPVAERPTGVLLSP